MTEFTYSTSIYRVAKSNGSCLVTQGWLVFRGNRCGEGFSGRNPSTPVPTTMTSADVVTLLRISFWACGYPLRDRASDENPRPLWWSTVVFVASLLLWSVVKLRSP
jgi:hypothetical protein